MKALGSRLPTSADRRVRILAIASLASQITIIGTGGAVRLTGSGLGCPTWPQCTPESFIPTPELGAHGFIEFANRTMAGVVALIALALFLSVVRFRAERSDLFALSLAVGIGTVAQALIGGLTVLLNLDPSIVGVHFVISIGLVVLSADLAWRAWFGREQRVGERRRLTVLVHATSFLVAVTIVVGILTTGSGPHAGDGGAARNGLDPEVLQHVHAWPAYAVFAATVGVVFLGRRMRDPRFTRFAVLLFAVELVQIAVGLAQSRLGLPPVLVGIHMVLAACLAAAMTAVVLALRAPASR